MRFRSLLVLALVPACALVDASGPSHGAGGDPSYTMGNVRETGAAPLSAVVAELDGTVDANPPKADVAVISESGALLVCISSGPNNFPVTTTSFNGYTLVTAADLDGDGKTELVAVGMNGKLDVLRPLPGGTTFTQIPLIGLPTTVVPKVVAAGILAGGPGVAVLSSATHEVFVFTNVLATPTMKTLTTVAAGPAGPPDDLVIGDVNSGAPGEEIIVSDSGTITTFSGPDLTPAARPIGVGTAPHITVGQFDDAGTDPDLAWLNVTQGPGEIGLYTGSPTGLTETHTFTGQGTVGDDLVMGDVDGDGLDDLAVVFTDTNQMRRLKILVRSGPLQFFRQIDIPVDGPGHTLSPGDLNGDGRTDFLLLPSKNGGVDMLLSN